MNLFSEGTKKGIGKAITALKQSHCVFFDVDSTIIQQEGLDEFARFLGKYDQIKKLTNMYILFIFNLIIVQCLEK